MLKPFWVILWEGKLHLYTEMIAIRFQWKTNDYKMSSHDVYFWWLSIIILNENFPFYPKFRKTREGFQSRDFFSKSAYKIHTLFSKTLYKISRRFAPIFFHINKECFSWGFLLMFLTFGIFIMDDVFCIIYQFFHNILFVCFYLHQFSDYNRFLYIYNFILLLK